MRDFSNFNQDADTGAAPLTAPPVMEDAAAPLRTPAGTQEAIRHDAPSSLHPIDAGEEEASNLPKFAGAALVALLVVGGGIYAYQSSTAPQPPKQVAANTPAPANTDIPPAAAPAAPPPVENSMPGNPDPAPAMKSAAQTPVTPAPETPVQAARAMTPGFGIGPTDNPNIDAPMTYTMDNVPPPQQEGARSQLAEAPAASQGPAAAMRQPAQGLDNPAP